MRVTVLNGPNLNLLGSREPEIYGTTTLAEIEAMLREEGARLGATLRFVQSNHEGTLIDEIQRLPGFADGLILNAAAYSHTSLAIRDALLAVRVPFVEVHLSDPTARGQGTGGRGQGEGMRRNLLFSDLAVRVITGQGAEGYRLALRELCGRLGGK